MIPKERTIAALGEEWRFLGDLLSGLSDDQWSAPTPLAGWDVKDNVAHIVGTEAMLLGIETPQIEIDRDRLAHVANDIGVFNEVWVEHFRSVPSLEVLSKFREYTPRRVAALELLSDDDWNAESFTPAGTDTYGRFMQIRVFDCWLHEQDIRDALGLPGHERGPAVEVTLDEMETAMGFVVGKRAGVEPGWSVTFRLTDGDDVVRTIHVDVAERAGVVESLPGDATTELTMPVGVMTRLCAGRVDVASVSDAVDVAGDAEVGERVLANLAYTV